MRRSPPSIIQKDFPFTKIHRSVNRWYKQYHRSLPWRTTHDPYKILLSEIMLQQTQANRAAEFYPRWLKRFPSIRSLAQTSLSDVLRTWSGLGYNKRAIRLHRLAKISVKDHASKLPKTVSELRMLPGIGNYTAHAVACFSYGHNVPLVDVNIQRILTRLTKKARSADEMMSSKTAWINAEKFLPSRNAYDWNQALMDLGASICTKHHPACGRCPIGRFCLSANAPAFTMKTEKKKKVEPSRKGIPRRLYRGRILKMLQHSTLTPGRIAATLWSTHSSGDRAWLQDVLNTMCIDGLIQKKKVRYTIA